MALEAPVQAGEVSVVVAMALVAAAVYAVYAVATVIVGVATNTPVSGWLRITRRMFGGGANK
ncbi:hypothetical protein DSM104440_00279 [Usitatibacter palustris]|uniref:Uncharacterized protein n=1 Tax=Usitatibacter palustris TaxID=2732487 RepID=A0A6M4H2E4_9PROT|nr:hypothetical protein DSM104440_00279 [Usitatibacter palustris]